MKTIFYENWTNNRIQKITSIFGESWFANKKILELGCAHGDIGKHFLKLGADVTFSDANEEFLAGIVSDLEPYNFRATTIKLDQNKKYDLQQSYDLVLHLSVLYHIENWKQDLKCAMKHSNILILETHVNPFPLNHPKNKIISHYNSLYTGRSEIKKFSYFNQESIENEIVKLGGRFLRLDSSDLNATWSWDSSNRLLRHIYDWDYDLSIHERESDERYNRISAPNSRETHFRRMYLILNK